MNLDESMHWMGRKLRITYNLNVRHCVFEYALTGCVCVCTEIWCYVANTNFLKSTYKLRRWKILSLLSRRWDEMEAHTKIWPLVMVIYVLWNWKRKLLPISKYAIIASFFLSLRPACLPSCFGKCSFQLELYTQHTFIFVWVHLDNCLLMR